MFDPYEHLFSYFSEWSKQGWTIKPVEKRLLQLYIGNFYSVYDIQSYLKTAAGYKNMHRRIFNSTDYKNIHRRIQKLKKLKLIEERKSLNKKSDHGAKYYKLSEKGICYIILNTTSFIGEYLNITQIIKLLRGNYPNSFIFRLFVNPFIEHKTIEEIYGTAQVTAFWQYLRNCCEAVQDLTNLNIVGEQVFIWKDVLPNVTCKFASLRDNRLAEFLKRQFNLNWLKNAQITKFESDEVVKISYQAKSVIIELIDNKTKALLKIDRKETMKMNVTVFRDLQNQPYVFDICIPPVSIQETRRRRLEDKVKGLASQLALQLLSYPMIENDIKVLSQDNKFVKLVMQVKKDFNNRCQHILEREFT